MLFLLLIFAGGCGPILHQPGPLTALGAPTPDHPEVALGGPVKSVHTSGIPITKKTTTGSPRGSQGQAIAKAATHWLSHTPRSFRDDCSGFVCASYVRAGQELEGNTRSIWEDAKANGQVHRRKRPFVGDLVFFDNTYDRNKNGRLDDELTHIGIVIAVSKDDTLTIAHGGTSKGRTTMKMNLRTPHSYTSEDGAVLNDYLRSRGAGGPSNKRLSGELWRAFATYNP